MDVSQNVAHFVAEHQVVCMLSPRMPKGPHCLYLHVSKSQPTDVLTSLEISDASDALPYLVQQCRDVM